MSGLVVTAAPTFAPKELIPAGPQIAICTEMIQIGTITQLNRIKGVEESKMKLHIGFQLVEVTHEYEGKEERRTTSKRYNLTLHENATLTADLQSWRGKKFTEQELKGFDLRTILGAPCMLNIQHAAGDGGKTYANIAGITPLHKSIPKPTVEGGLIKLSYADEDWDLAVFEKLPNWIKELMRSTPEFKAKGVVETPAGPTQPSGEPALPRESAYAKGAAPAVPVGAEDDNDLPF